jgi:hypothetical protein
MTNAQMIEKRLTVVNSRIENRLSVLNNKIESRINLIKSNSAKYLQSK